MIDGNIARLETVEADERFTGERVHRPVGIHDVDRGQIGALADLEVRFVVRGRDFQNSGAELELDLLIADDRYEFLLFGNLNRQRTAGVFADEMRVAFVARMHYDGG